MVGKSVLNNEGKATGQREVRPVWNNVQRVNHQNFSNNLTHLHLRRNFVPSAVITNSGKVPFNTAKQSSLRVVASISITRLVNTAIPKAKVNDALPTTYSYFQTHSPIKKPINKRTAVTNINFNKKVNTSKVDNVTTAGPKAVVGNPQYTLHDQGIFDSGCSRHMIGNKSFLIDYQEIDGGFELKFNLFSVSQMCDKKNSVLFTETECLVLSPDFKLLDESQVLLKVPRKNSMYSFDLNNVVPSGGKFDGKADEGFLDGYSINKWLFDIDSLTKSMNYEPVTARNQTNDNAGIETNVNAGHAGQEKASDHEYILLPFMPSYSPLSSSTQSSDDKDTDEVTGKSDEGVSKGSRIDDQERTDSSTHDVNTAGPSINTTNANINIGSLNINTASPIPNDLIVSPIPTTRVHKDHPKEQIIGDLNLATKTRRMINFSEESAMVSYINKQRRTNQKDYQNCLFSCFLSQKEPKNVIQALADLSWIEAMQDELLQFKSLDSGGSS
ncbi:hypothetical protein Tco_1153209 [Tanacetum coccineum]